jgi:pSer/pThr/pTyr-binding forkhead associated (FHA) protein
MDLFGRFRKIDSSLQRGLDNGFARVFGGEVVPAEIDELLKQEVEDTLMEDNRGTVLAASTFTVNVSQHDHDALLQKYPDLADELRGRLQRFIRNEGWQSSNPVTVDLVTDDGLHTGQLKSSSSFDPADTSNSSRSDEPRWPRSEPDSGRDSVAQPYDAAEVDGRAGRDDVPERQQRPAASSWSTRGQENADRAAGAGAAGTAGSAGAVGAAGAAGAAGAGAAAAGAAGAAAASPLSGLARSSAPATPATEKPEPKRSPIPDPKPDPRADEQAEQQPDQQAEQQPQQPDSQPEPPMASYPGTEVISHNEAEPARTGDQATGADDAAAAGEAEVPQTVVTLFLQDGSARQYVLQTGENVIGRGNAVDFRLPDTGVSRQHAEISWDGYDAVLTDLKSTNGTTVNDIPVENWLLADGDVVTIGHSEIEVRFN